MHIENKLPIILLRFRICLNRNEESENTAQHKTYNYKKLHKGLHLCEYYYDFMMKNCTDSRHYFWSHRIRNISHLFRQFKYGETRNLRKFRDLRIRMFVRPIPVEYAESRGNIVVVIPLLQ
jgi:hypothetical protein